MKKIPLEKGMKVFRNHNQNFSRQMAGDTGRRLLGLSLVLIETEEGVALEARDEDGVAARIEAKVEKQTARNQDQAGAVLKKQLGKLGNTPFELRDLTLPPRPLFFQARVLNQLRRDLVETLMEKRRQGVERKISESRPDPVPYPDARLDYRGNVANRAARLFYEKRGVAPVAQAFELELPETGGPVMITRHCLRRSLGLCPAKSGKKSPDRDIPLYLANERGKFRLKFDCRVCEMNILPSKG